MVLKTQLKLPTRGGFEVAGPGSCTGTGATLSCGGTGTGVGVVGVNVLYGVTVRNGVVRNMRLDGVGVGGTGSLGVRIEGITARHNARLGISGQDGVLATRCVAIENGGNGFDLDAGSVIESSIAIGNFGHGVEIDDVGGIVSGTTSRANAGRGFNIVALSKFGKDNVSEGNGTEDSCGGRFCSERKRFYGGAGVQFGSPLPSGYCDPGFRLLNEFELRNGNLAEYDGNGAIIFPEIPLRIDSNRKYGLSFGGSAGGVFECPLVNDINGTEQGLRCSNAAVFGLTLGWHIRPTPASGEIGIAICIEK